MAFEAGSIQYDIDVDTAEALSGLTATQKEANKLEAQVKKTDKATSSLGNTNKVLGTQMTKTAASVKAATSSMGGFGRKAGMAGVQIEQLVGQVAMGTSPMRAFSMQAADIGIVLGAPLLGAIVGITAAIAGPFITALIGANKELKTISSSSEEWLDNLKKKLEEAGSDLTSIQSIVKAATGRINNEIDKNLETITRLQENLENAKKSEAGFTVGKIAKEIKDLEERNKVLAKTIEDVTTAAIEASVAFDSLGSKEGAEQASKQSQAIAELTSKLNIQADLLSRTKEQQAEYNRQLFIGKLYAQDLSEAERELAIAAYDRLDAANAAMEAEKARNTSKASAEAFAGGVISRGQTEFERLSEEQTKIDELRAQGLISAQMHQDALSAIEKRGTAARQQQMSMAFGATSQFFDQTASLIGEFGSEASGAYKAAFALSKGFAIAQAGLNFSLALSQALALPSDVTLAQKFASYAAVASTAGSTLSAVKSAKYSGGRQYGGPVSAGGVYRVNETGTPEVLSQGGNDYLMATNNAKVTPLDNLASSSATNVIVNNYGNDSVDVTQTDTGIMIDIARREAQAAVAKQVSDVASGTGAMTRALRQSGNYLTSANGSR